MFLRGGNHNETHDLGCGGGRIPVTRTSGVFALPAVAQQEAKRSITELGPNLFRFQNNCHFFDFLVTDEGVVATDPIKAKLSGAVLRDRNMGPRSSIRTGTYLPRSLARTFVAQAFEAMTSRRPGSTAQNCPVRVLRVRKSRPPR